jgi:hypothetical protein
MQLLYVGAVMTRKQALPSIHTPLVCMNLSYSGFELFIFPMLVKYKPQEEVAICSFILELGVVTNIFRQYC